MGLSEAHLSPTTVQLEGFTNHRVSSKGTIEMEVVIGEGRIQKVRTVNFVVIDLDSPYNAILGTPSQSMFGLVVSVPHQRIKFQTNEGIGCVRSDPKSFYDHLVEEKRVTRRLVISTPEKEIEITGRFRTNKMIASSKVSKSRSYEMSPEINLVAPLRECIPNKRQKMAHKAWQLNQSQPTIDSSHVQLDTLEVREQTELTALETMEELIINPDFPEQRIKVGTEIPENEKGDIINVLRSSLDVFAWKVEDMEGISRDVAEHKLSISPEYKPMQQRARQFSREKETEIRNEVAKLPSAGIIEEVQYPTWIANVVMVLKASKKWRMCVDYVDLNKACPKDWYPLPRIDRLVDSISGHKILNFVDAYSGYQQIKMNKEDQIHTAFRAAGGIYCYRMMPFGLKNVGATYQRMVNRVFGNQIGRNLEAYIDDMVIKTRERSHAQDLKETFENLRRNHMKLNPSKCAFGVVSGKFLGIMVHEKGIEANPEKIRALTDMQPPKCLRQVQKLNGRVIALSRFISRAAKKCLPFFKTLKGNKSFSWDEECDQAFQQLKEYLSRPPLLSPPVNGEILFVYLASSSLAVASVLIREPEGIHRPVYYVSHALTEVESRYLDAEKIALAVVVTARRLRAYFMAHSIVIYTNSPLKKILHRPDVSGRLLRWCIELTEFDIDYQPRKAIRGQALADFLVESSFLEEVTNKIVEDELPMDKPRPCKAWSLYVDGSARAELCGAGILLSSPDGEERFEKAIRFKFQTSNNQAEYEALIAGIELARAVGVEELIVYCDSQLIVKQMLGEYVANHPLLVQYRDMATKLIRDFKYWELVQINRTENERADELAKLASDDLESQDELVWIEFLEKPAYDRTQIMVLTEERSWVDEMMDYLESNISPIDRDQARLLAKRASRYTVVGGILYRRSFSQPLLRCISPSEAVLVLEEVHAGACGGHPGARTLADKVISSGYYWPSLRKEAMAFARKCDKCQRFADIPRLPSVPQTPIVATWPFDMWGLDLVGGLVPAAGGADHLVVAVDYFTKWIEARPLKKISERATMKFVHDQVWCRFGLPRAMVSDHGTQFSAAFTAMLKDKGVEHWQSSISHPEGNGQAEAANKLIITGLKKTLDDRKGKWLSELPRILWAIRTTVRGPTKETPFSLCYGSEAMSPVETRFGLARMLHYKDHQNEMNRLLDLDMLEERRLEAKMQMINYKQKAKVHHDKRVNPRSFSIGDLVLRKIAATGRKTKEGKLGPNWEGPFFVTRIIREGTYLLSEEDGTPIPNPWHADHLKKYYV